jgi:hypothetical protein
MYICNYNKVYHLIRTLTNANKRFRNIPVRVLINNQLGQGSSWREGGGKVEKRCRELYLPINPRRRVS